MSKQLKRSHREFDYYARTHSVVDDGYNDVMALREKVILRQANADSMLSRVKRMLHSKPKSLSCKLLQSYTVSVVSPSDSGKVVIRRYKAALCRNNGDSLSLLQIAGNSLPKNTRHFSPWYFNPQNCMPLKPSLIINISAIHLLLSIVGGNLWALITETIMQTLAVCTNSFMPTIPT